MSKIRIGNFIRVATEWVEINFRSGEVMKAMDEIQDIGKILVSKVVGDKVLYEILPGLYQSGEIKEPKIIKDNGIQAVVDLKGST